jgi:hypothetical protein
MWQLQDGGHNALASRDQGRGWDGTADSLSHEGLAVTTALEEGSDEEDDFLCHGEVARNQRIKLLTCKRIALSSGILSK